MCFQIPNPELQLREIQDPEKPIGDPLNWLNYVKYFRTPPLSTTVYFHTLVSIVFVVNNLRLSW